MGAFSPLGSIADTAFSCRRTCAAVATYIRLVLPDAAALGLVERRQGWAGTRSEANHGSELSLRRSLVSRQLLLDLSNDARLRRYRCTCSVRNLDSFFAVCRALPRFVWLLDRNSAWLGAPVCALSCASGLGWSRTCSSPNHRVPLGLAGEYAGGKSHADSDGSLDWSDGLVACSGAGQCALARACLG